MLVFKYDIELFDIDECNKMYNQLKKQLPYCDIVAIPKTCDLYELNINQNKKSKEMIDVFRDYEDTL